MCPLSGVERFPLLGGFLCIKNEQSGSGLLSAIYRWSATGMVCHRGSNVWRMGRTPLLHGGPPKHTYFTLLNGSLYTTLEPVLLVS